MYKLNKKTYLRYEGHCDTLNGYDWVIVYGVLSNGDLEHICGTLDYPENRERYSKEYNITYYLGKNAHRS